MSTQVGPNLVTTPASNITSDNTVVGTVPWTSASAAGVNDGAYTVVNYSHPIGGDSELLKAVNFFSVSDFAADVSIVGIQARWERKLLVGGSGVNDAYVYMVLGGTIQTATNKSPGGAWTTSDAFTTAGGSTDTWGQSGLVGSQLHGTGFGCCLGINKPSPFGTLIPGVDFVEMTIWYEVAGGPTKHFMNYARLRNG